MHDLAALVLQLHLLGGKALLLDAANLRNQVARQLGGKGARLGNLLTTAQSGQLSLELGHTGSASTRSCLIRGHDHALHAGELMQRPRRNQTDDGRAVGVGDQAVVPLNVIGVNLGHDQRHLGIQTEGMAVVDHDGAALDGLGQQFLGDIVAGSAEYDVAALKGLGESLFDHNLLAAELDGLARRTRARQQLELANRKLLLVEALEHLGANSSRRAQNSNRVLFHASPFKGCGYRPHAKQAGYSCPVYTRTGRIQNPPRRNETEMKRPTVDFGACPKIYRNGRYLWRAARAGSTGAGASRSATFTMPFLSEKAR